MASVDWADLILVLHSLYVLGVILPVPVVIAGGRWGWAFVKNSWFRSIHLVMVLAVVVQIPLRMICPLTEWEERLRRSAGEEGPGASFIAYWLGRLLYYDLAPWLLAALHVVFGVLVVYLYIAIPPRCLRRLKGPSDTG